MPEEEQRLIPDEEQVITTASRRPRKALPRNEMRADQGNRIRQL